MTDTTTPFGTLYAERLMTPAVAAAGAALGDVLLAAEGGHAIAAVSGIDLDAGFVKKLHA